MPGPATSTGRGSPAAGTDEAGSASRAPETLPLRRHRDFTTFWAGQSISMFGTQITSVALPLTVVLSLQVSAGQLGLLRFLEYAPFLLFTMVFGVWTDRRRRRPLLIAVNLVRAMLVGSVPVLAVLGLLRLPVIAMVVFTIGVCAAMFEVCWLSYAPDLVPREHLVAAMGKLATSHSASEVAGPGVGGLLVQSITAPFVLILDALSYLVSVGSLLAIRHREAEPVVSDRRSVVQELKAGMRFVFRQPCIRATAYSGAITNFFSVVTGTVFLLYAVRELRFSPGLIGFVLAAGGAGGLLGAASANTVVRRLPLGTAYVVTRTIGILGALALPLATGPKTALVAVCMASGFLVQAALAVTNVVNVSLRQALTPEHLRGRMNATVRTITFGALPLGGLGTAVFGSVLGLHATLWLAAFGFATSLVPILASPVRRLRTMPGPATRAA